MSDCDHTRCLSCLECRVCDAARISAIEAERDAFREEARLLSELAIEYHDAMEALVEHAAHGAYESIVSVRALKSAQSLLARWPVTKPSDGGSMTIRGGSGTALDDLAGHRVVMPRRAPALCWRPGSSFASKPLQTRRAAAS